MTEERSSALEIGEDLQFHRRSWAVQRIGWVVMVALLLAGMFGVLGGAGPFVDTRAGGQDAGIIIDHQRFIRKRSPTELRINLLPGSVDSSEVDITIDRSYLDRFEIQYINPEPSRIAAGDSVIVYTFLLTDPSQVTAVTFNVEAERFGIAEGNIGLRGRTPVEISQITYP